MVGNLGGSTSSHGSERVETGVSETGWGQAYRRVPVAIVDATPPGHVATKGLGCGPPPAAEWACVALTGWSQRLLSPWVWCATVGGHLPREGFWRARSELSLYGVANTATPNHGQKQ